MKPTKYQIGDVAYIVEYCPEPTSEQFEAEGFDLIDWQHDETETPVFKSLVQAVAFARKIVRTSLFGVVDIYEAALTNPYSDTFPDYMVKRCALEWKKIEGGYECVINR